MDFHQVYERYAASVHRFAYWLCRDEQLAQDLTSESFVRAWLRMDKLQEPTLRSYLFAIARNLYLEDLRKHKREVDLDDDLRGGGELHAGAEQSDQIAWAGRAPSALSPKERTALLLRSVEELTYEEIAAALGISLSAAKVNVHRARMKLAVARAEMEKE